MNRASRFTVFLALAALVMLLGRVVINLSETSRNIGVFKESAPFCVDSLPAMDTPAKERIVSIDFENNHGADSSIRRDAAHGGRFGMVLNANHRFSPGLFVPAEKWGSSDSAWIVAEAWVMSPVADSLPQAFLVITGNRQGQTFKFREVPLPAAGIRHGTWSKVRLSWLVPTGTAPGDIFQAYLVNSGTEDLFIDDFTVDRFQKPLR